MGLMRKIKGYFILAKAGIQKRRTVILSRAKNPTSIVILFSSLFIALLAGIIFHNQITTFFSSAGADPIAYWKFDEGQGSTAYDSTGSYNGTLGSGNSSPSWISSDQCLSGSCLFFDGTNDHVSTVNDPLTNSEISAGTLAAWVRIGSSNPSGATISIEGWAQISYTTGAKVTGCSDGQCTGATSTTSVNDNKWHYLVATWSGTSYTNIYVDGKFEGIATPQNAPNPDSTSSRPIRIGMHPAGGSPYRGYVDEVKIYDYARSASQIKADYASRGTIKGTSASFGDDKISQMLSNGLVGYWKMDESSGDISDSSGNNNTLTDNNSNTFVSGKFGNGADIERGSSQYFSLGSGPAYSYYKVITIDNTKVSGSSDLTNFPVLISLTDVDLKTTGNGGHVENANGYDIIFKDSLGGTQLDHEIESYNASTGAIVMWVRIPTLSYNSDTSIYMYYGNSSISTSQENITGVWNSSYKMVQHLNETSGTHYDSTSNNNDSTAISAITQGSATGKIGGADDLNGSSNYITVADSTDFDIGTGNMTVSMWTYADTWQDNGLISYTNLSDASQGFWWVLYDDAGGSVGNINASINDTDYPTASFGYPWTEGEWENLVLVKSGTSITYYLNGSEVDTINNGQNLNNVNANFYIGRGSNFYESGNYFNGIIDEVRFSNTNRSAGWVITEYNNQNSPGTFFSVGTEQSVGGGGYQASSLDLAGDVSVSAWIKPESVTASTQFNIINKWDSGSEEYQLVQYGDELRMYINSSSNYIETTAANLSTGTWYNVVGVYDASKSMAQIYVNGAEQTTTTTGTIPSSITNTEGIFHIGAANAATTADNFYDGIIDEVRIYNRALAPEEVQTLYNYSIGPVAYWKFDEKSGSSAKDSTINQNNLTLASGSEPTWNTGKFGSALHFNSSKYQYASRSDSASLSITGDVSVGAWIKPNAVTASTEFPIAGKTEGDTRSYLLSQYGDEVRLYVGSASNYETTNAANLTVGQWYHVQGVYDASGQTVTLYVNGALNASTTTGTIPSSVTDDSNIFVVGYAQSGGETTLNLQVSTGNDDGDSDEAAALASSITRASIPLGSYSGNTHLGVARFNSVTVPQGATITSATFTLTGSDTYNCGSCNMNYLIEGDDVDDSAALTTGNMYNRTKTTANTPWSQQSIVLDTEYANTVTTVVQEIVDRGSWSSGNDMSIIVEDNGSDSNEWHEFYSYNGSSSKAPKLDITYSTAVTRYYNGLIDEVKVYNYARTPSQIVSDMNAGHPAPGSPIGSALLHYKLDEGYGNTVNNWGNMSSTLNGIISGTAAPVWKLDGKFGKALQFDGTNDYVRILDNSALEGMSAFTMSLWVNPSKCAGPINSSSILIRKTNAYSYSIRSDCKPSLYIHNGTSWSSEIVDTATVSLNTWTYLGVVYDGSKYYFYKNGLLTSSGTPSVIGNINSNSEDVGIGAWVTDMNYSYKGYIDEVKIYNFALDADQVKVEYNQGQAQVMGAGSTGIGGTGVSNSASRAYCVPGDSSTCNAPVGEWNFNENSGTSTYDTSGNNNIGTLGSGNSQPTWISGKLGKSLDFNGTTNYVTVADANSLDFGTSTDFSVSAWVTKESTSYGNLFHEGQEEGGSADASWTLNYQNSLNRMRFIVTSDTWNFYCGIDGNTNIADSKWHHVGVVVHRNASCTTSDIEMYVDGRQETLSLMFGNVNFNANLDNNDPFTIGAYNNAGAYSSYWDGKIDQVRIYNYARTPAQMNWEYNQGKPILYYPLDECTGTTVYNHSKNGDGDFISMDGTLDLGASGTTSAGTCSTSGAWADGSVGKIEASMYFDNNDDIISTPDSVFSDFPEGTDFTVSAWIKIPSLADNNVIFAKKLGNSAGQVGFMTYVNSSGQIATYISDGTDQVNKFTNSTITAGEWYYITMVYRDDTSLTMYINGKDGGGSLVGTIANVDGVESANDLAIGAESDGGLPFSGQIDEVKVYNYAITTTQMKTEMADGAVRFQ